MFDRIFDITFDHLKACLLLAGIFLAFLIHIAKKNGLISFERKLNIGLAAAALASFLSFYNFGFFHFGGGHFHTHDLYHYYMGSKYFKEVGYLYLYDATIAADEESTDYMRRVTTIRDQSNYNSLPRESAHRTMDKWRVKFTPERWREFKADLIWFQKQPHSWQWWGGIVNDFGYNPSPAWTMIAHQVSNLIPTGSTLGMLFIAYLDGILALIMFYMIYRAFDLQTMLFSALYWGSTFTFVFSFTGASMLRHDWIVYMVIAICMLKMARPYAGGAFYALSSGLRVFPALFGFPVLASFIVKYVRERKCPVSDAKFLIGAMAAGAAILAMTLLFVPGELGSWPAFLAKMKVHKESWNTWNWGFIDIFLWQGEVYDDLPNNWKEAKMLRIGHLMPFIVSLQIITAAALALVAARMKQWENLALGGLIFFLFLNPTKYYFVHLITLVPLFASRLDQLWRVKCMSLLFAIMIMMFVINSFNQAAILLQFIISTAVYLLYLYTLYSAYRDSSRHDEEEQDVR